MRQELQTECSYRSVPTLSSLALARLCYDTLLEFGLQAKLAVEKKSVTPAVKRRGPSPKFLFERGATSLFGGSGLIRPEPR